jgi:protein phosphatase
MMQPVDRRDAHGPFDLIGDVHGCSAELRALLARLGYTLAAAGAAPPAGRTAVFLGDLVDRGPDAPGVVTLVMEMVACGAALCLRGNHEEQMLRRLADPRAPVAWGLAETLEQLAARPPELTERLRRFAQSLPSHCVLDGGKLIAAHAGLPEPLHGSESPTADWFALYATETGTARRDWAASYRGEALVVYGHTPTPAAEWRNRTICIDTGCVYGGSLTALRYPELELVSVSAAKVYYRGA